jgi:monoamine oxidase
MPQQPKNQSKLAVSVDVLVCDRSTRAPLAGALVILSKGQQERARKTTDAHGFATFSNLPRAGDYSVEVQLAPQQHGSSWLIRAKQPAPIPSDGQAFVLFRAEPKPVVVVGAGAAGLKAANDLLEAGCTVHLLEARNRIGGRAYSDTSLGVPVDLGCQWLHGAPANPWVQEAQRLKVKTPRQVKEDYYLDPAALTVTKSSELDTHVGEMEWAIEQALEKDGSDSAAAGVVSGLPLDTQDPWYPVAVARVAAAEESAELDEFSAIDRHETHENKAPPVTIGLPGLKEEENYISPALGFGGLIAKYGQDLQERYPDRLRVELSTPVSRIDSTATGPVVHMQGGRGGTLAAAAVIVAVPTAIVASRRLQFTPPLPLKTFQSFEKLPLGSFNKVALKFKCDIFSRASYPELKNSELKEFLKGFPEIEPNDELWPKPSRAGNVWKFICNLQGSHVVVGFIGGKFAKALEAESDKSIADKALERLASVLGPYGPYVKKHYTGQCVISRWGSEPYTGGAYSYTKPGGRSARKHLFGQPLANKNVFFAGEALLPQCYGTAHGAYVTGREAARWAVNRIKLQEQQGQTVPGPVTRARLGA